MKSIPVATGPEHIYTPIHKTTTIRTADLGFLPRAPEVALSGCTL